MSFLVQLLDPNAVIPTRATIGSAGLDLSSTVTRTIQSGKWALIPVGISLSFPNDCYARIAPRSGMSNKGLFVNAGVIDSDYRGQINVIIHNNSAYDYTINTYDKIAQLIFEKIYNVDLNVVDYLDSTVRGANGFGSTDIKK